MNRLAKEIDRPNQQGEMVENDLGRKSRKLRLAGDPRRHRKQSSCWGEDGKQRCRRWCDFDAIATTNIAECSRRFRA
jgi:hypothetical protein